MSGRSGAPRFGLLSSVLRLRGGADAPIQSLLYLAGLASFLGPASISIYTPSLVALRESFHTSNALAGATVSAFSIVLAASQLLYGPVIDRFSRKVVLAAGLVVGGALVSDRFPPQRRASAMGTLQSFNAFGASLGPVIGSGIIDLGFAWQADFVALAIAGLLVALGVAWLLPAQAAPAERFSPGAILAVLRLPATLAVTLLGFAQYYGHVSLITFAPVVLREHAGLDP